MGSGPLADSRLQEIESRLDAGRFDEAQQLLSRIGNLPNAETASAYFATRLLFQRGRMDQSGVIQRLRELLAREPEFPEAARMLAAAEAGVLAPDPEVFRRVTGAPDTSDADSIASATMQAPSQREIPRAPLVPRFTPRTVAPSYAPSTPLAPRREDAPDLPPIPSLQQTMRGVGEPGERNRADAGSAATDARPVLPTLDAARAGLPLIPSLEMPAIESISTLAPPEAEPQVKPLVAKPLETRSGAYSMRSASQESVENALVIERGRVRAAEPTPHAASSSRWGAEEASLAHGNAAPCLERLARKANDAVRARTRQSGPEQWQALAVRAARTLTELPVFRHFAPYDCSIFSVDRLEAALSLVWGKGGAGRTADEPTLVLLAAYVGESFRQAFGAEWHGAPSSPLAASVQGIGLAVRPGELIRERMQRGVALSIETPHALHPGADPLGNSVPLSLVPPAPWDPAPFPSIEQFSTLGRCLRDSVVGVYCERSHGLALDLTIPNTVALDRYVALLAPSQAPPDPEAPWARRAALLLGAYLGEVLVAVAAAKWETDAVPKSLEDYRLVLPQGNVATPAVQVRERLAGRRPAPLSEYVARLVSGRNSISA